VASLLIAICTFSASAQQVDRSVFGIELGKPLVSSIPECAVHKEKESKIIYYVYNGGDKTTCFKRIYSQLYHYDPLHVEFGSPMVAEEVTIQFSLDQIPFIVRGYEIHGTVIADSIESISFHTGLSSEAISALTNKYGKENSSVKGERQNEFGVKYPTVVVEWKLQDLSITFSNKFTEVEEGIVFIRTDKWESHRQLLIQERLKKSTL
jgi:hypothetical protein